MKKLLVIALIALFMAGSAYVANASVEGTGVGDILGQGKLPSDPHRIFRLVHISPNDNDADGVTADSCVVWDDEFDDGVSVELGTVSGDGRVAGILVTKVVSNDTSGAGHTASEDIGTSNWGWLQTYGLYTGGYCGPEAITAGKSICADDDGNGSIGQFGQIQATSGNAGILGCSLDAISAYTKGGEIFIKCD